MQRRRKLLSILPRLGQSHPDDDEESRCLLGGGKKTYRGHGWGLAIASQNNQNEKQQMWREIQRAWSFYTKVSSLSSIISRRKGPGILSLQESVLCNIYRHLPLVDKACLSLSCKRFFDLFGTILKEKEFEFSPLLHHRILILCVTTYMVTRNQLLVRLQSRSWKYCGRCLILHPRKKFCKNSLASPALQRSCESYQCIVDICPCASLTIQELGHIVKLLKSPTPPSQIKFGLFTFDLTSGTQQIAYVSPGFHLTRGHTSDCHRLPITSEYEARVERIRISIDSSNNLDMFAQYTVYWSSRCYPFETSALIPLSSPMGSYIFDGLEGCCPSISQVSDHTESGKLQTSTKSSLA